MATGVSSPSISGDVYTDSRKVIVVGPNLFDREYVQSWVSCDIQDRMMANPTGATTPQQDTRT